MALYGKNKLRSAIALTTVLSVGGGALLGGCGGRTTSAPGVQSPAAIGAQLERLNLGWGQSPVNADHGISGYSVLPNGEQVDVAIFSKDKTSNPSRRINPSKIGEIVVDVYSAGQNIRSINVFPEYEYTLSQGLFDSLGDQVSSDYEVSQTRAESTPPSDNNVYYVSAIGNTSVETSLDNAVSKNVLNANVANSTAIHIEHEVESLVSAVAQDRNLPQLASVHPSEQPS